MQTRQQVCEKKDCRRRFTPAPGAVRRFCYFCRPLPGYGDPHAPRTAPAGPGPVADPAGPVAPPAPVEPGRYEVRALAVLTAKGAAETMAGEIALGIARAMDNSSLSPPQAISAGKDLLKIMDQAIAEVPPVADGIDAAQERALKIAESA